MVKKKVKYIASVFLMIVIAFTFIFSTFLRVINRDTSKAVAAVQVRTFAELQAAINGEEGTIEIENDIDIPCEHINQFASAGSMKTAQIAIERSVTIKSIGSGTKTLKRTSVDSEDGDLVSMFEIIGDGITVNFENIILDGGATLPENTGDRIDFNGSGSICGRALIDVLKNSTLNIGNNCTIQNSFNNSIVSAHGYNKNLPPCGGAIRTDCYSDGSVNLSGGTINLLSGSEIKDCSTKAKSASGGYATTLASYGGAVAAYNSGTINMESGATIQNCTSSNGGAIGLCHGPSTPYTTGTLNLNGGTIKDCYAIKGGAINVGENSDETPRLNLTGTGSTYFSNCQSQEGGGVLYIDTGNKIQLAENQDNTGNVQIATNCTGDSAKGSDGDNIPANYAGYKNKIEFAGATDENSSYFETCCVTNNTGNTENNNNNNEVINHPNHENWTYSIENNNTTLKASCGTCDFSVSLQLCAPSAKNYDGNAIDAATFDETESKNWTDAGLTLPAITYEGTGTTSYDAIATPPTNAGAYVAKISATETDNVTKTAQVSFNINKANPTLDLFDISGLTEQTYDGNGKSVNVTEKNNKTEFTDKVTVEYYYTKDDTEGWYTEAPANAGEYNVRLVIAGADNYSDNNIELGDSNKLKIEKATGIRHIRVSSSKSQTVYDLQGRRVAHPKQGEIYIQKGKKVKK